MTYPTPQERRQVLCHLFSDALYYIEIGEKHHFDETLEKIRELGNGDSVFYEDLSDDLSREFDRQFKHVESFRTERV